MTDSIAATDAAAPPRLAGGSVTPALRPPSARVFELPSPLPLRQCMPLVPGLPATSQRNLHLGPAVLEVEGQRHDREPALLDSPLNLVDLRAVQQQLALAAGCDVGPRRLGVLRDVHLVQPDLTVLYVGEPVDEGGAAGPQRLDLGADEDDASLPPVLEGVVGTCPPVARDHELRFLTGHDSILAASPRQARVKPEERPSRVDRRSYRAVAWRCPDSPPMTALYCLRHSVPLPPTIDA